MKNIDNKLIQKLIKIWDLNIVENKNNHMDSKDDIQNNWTNLYNIIEEICLESSSNQFLENQIIDEVIKRFSQHDMVTKIYYDEKLPYKAEYSFYIITKNTEYDDKLMGELLDIEWEICDIFEDKNVYPSCNYHYNSYASLKLIYERENNES